MLRCRPCCLLLLLLSPLLRAAEPAAEVIWYYPDFPPTYIVAGPYKGEGLADKREAFILRALGEFRHSRVMANTARMMQDMRQREICQSAMLKTPERETFMVFSEPVAELLPAGLIVSTERKAEIAPHLNPRGEVRLPELLKAGRLKVLMAAGRSYGEHVDAALKLGRNKRSVEAFYAPDLFVSGLLTVVRQKKADAVVGYPIELIWAQQQFELAPDTLLFLPIESETQLLQSRVGCSRGPTGEAVVAHVNELLRNGQLAEVAERAYLEWVPEANHAYYRQLRQTSKRESAPAR
ncbi:MULTISPECIES: TIGR02285 family protein [unclassified Uliginosibacterium]|uniref:TIGR02285 family protein n=1 Tax=unclassified Uliginosibacterium TaxID=2621521 RepID=UPI0013041009|nr:MULTISPECIES: TIGR02285 family protein [unclassified Uliginosibacterium]MDO6387524.1 TIGR02285 family protein [Uliginosibacterium sp. 31-12]